MIDELAPGIPLPPGGTFDDIQWDAATTREIAELTLQFNAACDWWTYWLEGFRANNAQQTQAALAGMKQMTTWSRIRNTPGERYFREAADKAELGDPSGVEKMLTGNCGVPPGAEGSSTPPPRP